VSSAHQQFISALDNIWPVIESTWDGSICGGSSALSYIGSSSEAAQVRTTAKALAAADAAHPVHDRGFRSASHPQRQPAAG